MRFYAARFWRARFWRARFWAGQTAQGSGGTLPRYYATGKLQSEYERAVGILRREANAEELEVIAALLLAEDNDRVA